MSLSRLYEGESCGRRSVFDAMGIGDISRKRALVDQGDGAGEIDLASLFRPIIAGDVFSRGNALGVGGGARGVKYLSAGFIVLISLPVAPTDALRSLNGLSSTGTHRRLTGCPGKYWHAVVNGRVGLWTSMPSSISYCYSNQLSLITRAWDESV